MQYTEPVPLWILALKSKTEQVVTGKSQYKGDKDKDDSAGYPSFCSLQRFVAVVIFFFQFRENEILMYHQQNACLERLLLLRTCLSKNKTKQKNQDSFMYVLKYVTYYITVDVTAYYESVKKQSKPVLDKSVVMFYDI